MEENSSQEEKDCVDASACTPSPPGRRTSFAQSFFDSAPPHAVLPKNTPGLTNDDMERNDMAMDQGQNNSYASPNSDSSSQTGRPDTLDGPQPPPFSSAKSLSLKKAPPPPDQDGSTVFLSQESAAMTNTNRVLPTPRARPSNLQRRISTSARRKSSLSSSSMPAGTTTAAASTASTAGLVVRRGTANQPSIMAMAAALSDVSIAQGGSGGQPQPQEQQPGDGDLYYTTTTTTTTRTADPLHLPVDRQPSWLLDALQQGQGMNVLQDILGVPGTTSSLLNTPGSLSSSSSSLYNDPDMLLLSEQQHLDDPEVMEQYRIMAQLDARQLFKEKVGVDVDEYVELRRGSPKRAAEQASNNNDSSTSSSWSSGGTHSSSFPPVPAPSFEIPDPVLRNKLLGTFSVADKLPGPPLPPLSEVMKEWGDNNNDYNRNVPQLQKAKVISNAVSKVDTARQRKEHIVRCQGCKKQLQVDIYATLVSCPSCSTVSPNTSSRR